MHKQLAVFVGVFGILVNLLAQDLPQGFMVADQSLSPDGRYGVIVPMRGQVSESSQPKNRLIEIKAGKVLADLAGAVSWDKTNHETILPVRWAGDGSVFLWEVEGKWFPHALTLVRLREGAVVWQVDVLKRAQEEILARTRKAVPDEYAKARAANAGNGAAYPEGFSVDVSLQGELVFPVRFAVALTSNPKGIEGVPTVESHMEMLVDENGGIAVKGFGMGAGESENF